MTSDNLEFDPDEKQDEEEVYRAFLAKLFPAIFVKAILEAKVEDRNQLAERFGAAPSTTFGSIKDLFRCIAEIQHGEKRLEEAQLLLKYAKIASNAFLQNKTQKVKSGLSIQYVFNGEVVQSIGHALNEGFTERMGRSVMDEYVKRDPSFAKPEEYEEFRKKLKGAYLLEIKFADKLVGLFGEQLVGRAYFGDFEDLEHLMKGVDDRFGKGSFVRLLILSDTGDWRKVFHLLKS